MSWQACFKIIITSITSNMSLYDIRILPMFSYYLYINILLYMSVPKFDLSSHRNLHPRKPNECMTNAARDVSFLFIISITFSSDQTHKY